MNWFALLSNAVLPAFTAFKYGQFALAPGNYDDAYVLSLIVLFMAQVPLAFLGAIFAGVSAIEGPTWLRALVYFAFVAVGGVVTVVADASFAADIGPFVAWAVAMQLVMLLFIGVQPKLARARIDAMMGDSINLTVLTVFGGFVAIIAAALLQQHFRDARDWQPIELEWSDVAWIGAFYFLLRTWSACYAYTPAFEARGKGFFQRPWIEALLRTNPKGD